MVGVRAVEPDTHPAHHRGDGLARLQIGAATIGHNTNTLDASDPGEVNAVTETAGPNDGFGPIEPDRTNVDQYPAISRSGVRHLFKLEGLWTSRMMNNECAHNAPPQ